MVLGDNGIINYAKKAKKITTTSSTQEKIQIAIANYEIEKIQNSEENISFKEYMENQEKSGLTGFEMIEENPSEDVKFIATMENKTIIAKADGKYVVTGENLVRNGFGQNSNENFESFTNNNGELSKTTNERELIESSDYIEINPNKEYYQAMIGKVNNEKISNSIGIIEYDCDKKYISDTMISYVPNTLTYLEKELKNGDTEIYVHDLSNFIKSRIYNNGLIIWNYKDSTGFEYPELTYSRNVYYNLFDLENNGLDLENNKIILNSPWNHGTIPEKTKVSQSEKGSNYNYGVSGSKRWITKYRLYENTITGTDYTGKADVYKKFRPGTKYVKILFWINMNKLASSQIDVKDIIFAECE